MKKSTALQYNGSVPKVLISAKGQLVQEMMQIAEKNGIPVYKDEDLAELLGCIPDGSELPEELFSAVVQVFTFCYNVNEKFKERINKEL